MHCFQKIEVTFLQNFMRVHRQRETKLVPQPECRHKDDLHDFKRYHRVQHHRLPHDRQIPFKYSVNRSISIADNTPLNRKLLLIG